MTKQPVGADEVSFVARRVIGPPPRLHKAFASTGAVCTASAARMPGTIVNEVCRATADGIVRIGHPSGVFPVKIAFDADGRSEEHTSELQSLMRISYAVFCLKKTNTTKNK